MRGRRVPLGSYDAVGWNTLPRTASFQSDPWHPSEQAPGTSLAGARWAHVHSNIETACTCVAERRSADVAGLGKQYANWPALRAGPLPGPCYACSCHPSGQIWL